MYILGLEGMRLFVVVDEGVELPCPNGGVFFAIRGNVLCGFKVGFQQGFGFRSGQEFELGVGVLEGGRVPLLAGRLVFLVVFLACTVKLFTVTHVEIAAVTAVCLAVDLVDAG